MRIRIATDVDQPAWDAYVLAHADGLAYHQFAWGKAVAEAYHFDSCYLVAERHGAICGVLPLIDFRCPFVGRSFISLPYCDLGGCLVDDPEVERKLLFHARELAAAERISCLELRGKQQPSCTVGCRPEETKVRMVLDLPDSASALLEGLKSKLRSQVLKPQRDGLSAQLGGVELLDAFYQVFATNMHELGSPVHSKNWFAAIVKHYAAHARVGLVLTPAGEPAAGGILLSHGRTVSVPWASSLRRFKRLNSNMLLYWTFLAFAADNGFALFDFGRSMPGDGTYRFKEQWGARPQPLAWRRYAAEGAVRPLGFSRSQLRHTAEQTWARLPLRLCNTFGPLVRRHISL